MDHKQNEKQQRKAEGSHINQPRRPPQHDDNKPPSRRTIEVPPRQPSTTQAPSRQPSDHPPKPLRRQSTPESNPISSFTSFEHDSDSIFRAEDKGSPSSEEWEILDGHSGEDEGVSCPDLRSISSYTIINTNQHNLKTVLPHNSRQSTPLLRLLPRNMARGLLRNHLRALPRRRRNRILRLRHPAIRHPQSRIQHRVRASLLQQQIRAQTRLLGRGQHGHGAGCAPEAVGGVAEERAREDGGGEKGEDEEDSKAAGACAWGGRGGGVGG